MYVYFLFTDTNLFYQYVFIQLMKPLPFDSKLQSSLETTDDHRKLLVFSIYRKGKKERERVVCVCVCVSVM